MSNFTRPLATHLRNQSMGGSQQQSPVLLARIAEKKAELANLKDLQALSGGLADQMQMLADKLSTLSDGTEGMSEAKLSSKHWMQWICHADFMVG
jgi:DASH complex subunit DAD2